MIFLGDLFDFLFGLVEEAVEAAGGLLRLIAAKMAAPRLVFLAGNHDHHLVYRDAENRLEARLVGGQAEGQGACGPPYLRTVLERLLAGVEVEIAYPPTALGASFVPTATTSTPTPASAARGPIAC